jgi:hypothetical protein
MTVAFLVLAALVAGLVVWDRLSRPSDGRSTRVAPPTPRVHARPPAATPRFQGHGVVPARTAECLPPPRALGGRIVRRDTAAPQSRFSGGVRRSPNAIGLACGRPIAECPRGGVDCLCVD